MSKRILWVILPLIATAALAAGGGVATVSDPTAARVPADPNAPLIVEVPVPPAGGTDAAPPFGTVVQQWNLTMGGSYSGAGITYRADSNRFYLVDQGYATGENRLYSFDAANPSTSPRRDSITYPNLGSSTRDIAWGIGWDQDSNCFWITQILDNSVYAGCYLLRFNYNTNGRLVWGGTVRDSWRIDGVMSTYWLGGIVKKRATGYFYGTPVASGSNNYFVKFDPYTKTLFGRTASGPSVSERGCAFLPYDSLYIFSCGWNENYWRKRDSSGTQLQQVSATVYGPADWELWNPESNTPDDTVFLFCICSNTSNTLQKISTGIQWGSLPGKRAHNISCRQFLAPAGTIDSGQVITPQVVVRNTGTFAEDYRAIMMLPGGYSDTIDMVGVPRGRTDTLNFALWTPSGRDSMSAYAFTTCNMDSMYRDDTAYTRFLIRVKDVAVVGIVQPVDTVDSGTVMYPQAWIWNYGNQTASFPVQFRIGSYTSSANVVNLIPGAQRLVTAPDAWTAIPGVYDHTVNALLTGDLRPANNTMTARVIVPGLVTRDVGVVSIDEPIGAVDTTMTFAPKATVHNYGTGPATFWTWFMMTGPSGLAYSESLQTMLGSGGQLQLTFPSTRMTVIGSYNMVCSTYYSGDQVDTNNVKREHLWVFGRLAGDIGVTQILQPPSQVDTGVDITPEARWHNYSSTEATSFTAYAILYNPAGSQVYLEDSNVTLLAPGADITILFPAYNVHSDTGWWVCRCSTYAPGDTVLTNNVLDKRFEVMVKPPWEPGWHEVQSVPAAPSTKALKDGAWLTMDVSSGLIYAAKGNKTSDFYKYDAQADTNGEWTQLTNWPNGTEGKLPSKGANGCPDFLGHVYATKGNNTQGFWRYNTDSLTWAQMPVVPMGASMKRVKGGTDMVYVTEGDTGYVYLLKGYKQDFFRFNAMSGVWDTSLPQAPAGLKPKWDKGSWLVHDGLTTLYAHKAKYHELWTFDLTTHTWATAALPGMPLSGMMGKSKKSKDGGSAAYYDGAIYALKGGNTQEWWKYQIDSARWTELETIPAFGSTAKKKRVKGGGDVTSYGGGYFFAFKGNKTLEHWRYGLPQPVYGFRPHGGVMAQPVSRRSDLTVQPNPVTRGWAELSYSLPQAGPVRVTVYDITGRGVAGGNFVAGRSGTARLDLRQLSSGVYLVKVSAPGVTLSRKLIVQ
jgi:hypothetical protein